MTSHTAGDPFGLLDPPHEGAVEEARASGRWRRSVEWSATSAPVAFLLLAGIALGPQGISLLSPGVLSALDAVVPVALAALGVLVGLSLGDRRVDDRPVLAAASVDAAVTMLVVGGAAALASLAGVSVVLPSWTLAVAAGICAATSLTLPTNNPLEPRPTATRVIELGVLLPIVAGGLVLAWLRTDAPAGAVVLVLQVSGLTVALAAAGWLLLTPASSETDERVFAISALLLVGGVADALAVSALFGGLVAGVFWRYAGGGPRDRIRRDVLFVQHPLLVLVLLMAGARAELSVVSLAVGVGYLALRVVGKLAGGMLAGRVAAANAPADLGLHLLRPGVFGVAFALNVFNVVGTDASPLITAVVVGTIGSELVAVLVPARSVAE